MYTPFFGPDGKPLSIEQVTFEHLMQLKECDEGHHIEYKQILEDGGKNHIAKVIASFSNCEGGWVFVGIEDNTKEILPIRKLDYSKKIGKIVQRVSPMPEFETRFVSNPKDSSEGVLIIYVYEGRNAPYICDGSIYVRCGSNKEPIKAADRGNVEYLLKRSELYRKELDAFFHRDYYFDFGPPQLKEKKFPFVSLFLKNINFRREKVLREYEERRVLIDFVKNKEKRFGYAQFTTESVFFMLDYSYPKKGGTVVMELFYDYSCKIYVPLGNYNIAEIEEAKELYRDFGIPDSFVNDYNIFDACIMLDSLSYCINVFSKIAEMYQLREEEYVFCSEIENIGNAFLCFSNEKYRDYIHANNGIPFAVKNHYKSKCYFMRDYPEIQFLDLASAVISDFVGASFGFDSEAILDMLDEQNRIYGKD